jgi:hypothetical protein
MAGHFTPLLLLPTVAPAITIMVAKEFSVFAIAFLHLDAVDGAESLSGFVVGGRSRGVPVSASICWATFSTMRRFGSKPRTACSYGPPNISSPRLRVASEYRMDEANMTHSQKERTLYDK